MTNNRQRSVPRCPQLDGYEASRYLPPIKKEKEKKEEMRSGLPLDRAPGEGVCRLGCEGGRIANVSTQAPRCFLPRRSNSHFQPRHLRCYSSHVNMHEWTADCWQKGGRKVYFHPFPSRLSSLSLLRVFFCTLFLSHNAMRLTVQYQRAPQATSPESNCEYGVSLIIPAVLQSYCRVVPHDDINNNASTTGARSLQISGSVSLHTCSFKVQIALL